jgi:REP element-mobilizing transposase RayT
MYFVTIATAGRDPLFGAVRDGVIELSTFGRIVEREWLRTRFVRHDVELDAYVVMPDHFHAIVTLHPTGCSTTPTFHLGAVVRAFKATCSVQINHERGTPGAAVWQSNYYERILHNADALARVRLYIAENPAKWRPPRWRP